VEHQRYHLDLRHPAARAHLDEVVDRLVRDFGVGFFKLDYNINPGPGTDRDADSVGAGLLAHNRAHLYWLEGLHYRHPVLVLENCGSGGMRSDYAMLSRLQMQSTSDQQDFLKYPPIAAAAPVAMLPEQAANWAYPQPEMTEEEVAFCLATGLLGRYYVSGHVGRMEARRLALVTDAIAVAKSLRGDLTGSTPFWPLGMPSWEAAWIALGLSIPGGALVTLWDRGAADKEVELLLPEFTQMELTVSTVFPRSLPEWLCHWDAEAGRLRVASTAGQVGARVFRIQAAQIAAAATHSEARTQ
jgi:alpha-galactosidase